MTKQLPTILIVDDEPHMLRLVGFTLRTIDATIITATSGLDALEIIRTRPVALGIFDVHMKDVDGLTAVAEIRQDSAHRLLPIIFLTGAGETHIEAEGRALGVQAFFRKPFSPAQLAARVRELLAAHPTE